MDKVNGNWIMRGCALNDPGRLVAPDDLLRLIHEVGFLPLFANSIPGFSVEERTAPDSWWTGDPESDPWEWRAILAASDEIAYGKFFQRKAGFVSKDWFPTFANYRRNGYDFDALFDDGLAPYRSKKVMDAFHLNERMEGDSLSVSEITERTGETERALALLQERAYLIIGNFQQRRSKNGKPFGLPSALYVTPETKWGYGFVTGEYSVSPSQSWQTIAAQVKKAYPGTDDAQIQAALGIRYPNHPVFVVKTVKKKEKPTKPEQLPYPENIITAIGLDLVFHTEKYVPLTEDQMRGLEFALGTLKEKERKAIELRFERHLTLKKTAEYFQRSSTRIGQVMSIGIRKLRHPSRLRYYRYGYAAILEMRKLIAQNLAAALESEDASLEWAENINIDALDISIGIADCLIEGGYDNLAKLLAAMRHPEELLKIKRFDKMSLFELAHQLKKCGELYQG